MFESIIGITKKGQLVGLDKKGNRIMYDEDNDKIISIDEDKVIPISRTDANFKKLFKEIEGDEISKVTKKEKSEFDKWQNILENVPNDNQDKPRLIPANIWGNMGIGSISTQGTFTISGSSVSSISPTKKVNKKGTSVYSGIGSVTT